MNSVLDEILRTGRTTDSAGATVEVHSAISRNEAEYLQKLVAIAEPRVSLEIGLAYGVSALAICEAVSERPGAKHLLIDPVQTTDWGGIGLLNLQRAGYREMVEFFEEPSHAALPRFAAEGRRVQFAFIDGWHTFDYAMLDFFFADKMLEPGGIVAIDDADWPSIRKLCRFIATNLPHYEPLPCPPAWREQPTAKRRLVESLPRLPGLSRVAGKIFRPEALKSDRSLGLHGTLIAFKKLREDERRWDFHREF